MTEVGELKNEVKLIVSLVNTTSIEFFSIKG